MTEVGHIDQAGRLVLPAAALAALGGETGVEVAVEVRSDGVLIKPRAAHHPVTDRVAAMALSVADWAQMEVEIAAGWSGDH